MKKITMLLFVLIASQAYAQDLAPVETTKRIYLEASLNALRWGNYLSSLDLGGGDIDSPLSCEQMEQLYQQYLDTLKNKNTLDYLNRKSVISFYEQNEDSDLLFWDSDTNGDFPVEYLKYKNESDLLLVEGGFTDCILNSSRFTEKQRAASIIEENLSKVVKKFAVDHQPSVQWCGIVCAFGTRDFSDEFDRLHNECVVVVSPIDAIRQFANAQITLEEFVLKSDVYMQNKNLDFNKINLFY